MSESVAHIARHGVSPTEVEDVLFARPRFIEPGRSATTLVVGRTAAGRYLAVVIAEAADGSTYVVTARDMTETERRTLRRKGR